jgi:outer membrane protein
MVVATGCCRIGLNSPAAWTRRFALSVILACALPPALAAEPQNASDPFATQRLAAPAPEQSVHPGPGTAPCEAAADPTAALSLADIVSSALCSNPQTRAAWANALVQAAQVGIARSAYLPTLTASASVEGVHGSGALGASSAHTARDGTGNLSLGYVLYDFGARDAALDVALQTVASANYTQDATLQRVILSAVQAYYQLFGTRDAVASTEEAELAARRSLEAATARYQAGTATPSDRLLAQTAYSQAVLNRIQARGAEKSAEGALANVMGAAANHRFQYVAPQLRPPDRSFEGDIDRLIAVAVEQRPDLAAAQAQVEAAAAGVRVARASGMPTISLSANINYTDSSVTPAFNTQTAGILFNIPLFTGYNTTYRIRSARAQLEGQIALRDSLKSQVALDVWQAYYALETGTEAVRSTTDLVASAQAAERVALGRYQAGAGTILDTLTAQAALANARLQHIQAQYSWYVLRANLAQALGQLDPATATSPNAVQ